MNRIGVAGLLVLGLASIASAGVLNGDFNAGMTDWQFLGGAGIRNAGDFGFPDSPSGTPAAGVISSWGGDWSLPLGIIIQDVTGVVGPQTLSGELFAGAHSADAWRNVAVEVLWNDEKVADVAANADPVKWAADFSWSTFSVPVVGTGADTLTVNFIVHFAEWSWVAVDNLAVTPEPASLLLLALGLPLLRRRR